MRKMLVAKITPFFVLAFFLGALMLAPHSALAKTVTTITTAQPLACNRSLQRHSHVTRLLNATFPFCYSDSLYEHVACCDLND